MVFIILLSGVLLVVLPGLARRTGRLLAPREWSLLCAVALAGGALLIEIGVVLLASPPILLAIGAPALASACERLLGPLLPGGPLLGMVALPAAVAIPVLAALGLRSERRRCRQMRVEPWVGSHQTWQGIDVVVLPTEEVVALSLEGDRPQILVSKGMTATLTQDELAAVLRHERAHLRHRHHWFLALAVIIDRGLPFLHRSTSALRTGLERWADEASVAGDASARAVLRGALLRASTARATPLLPAFSPLETVMERLDALQAPPRRPSRVRRGLAYSPGIAIAVLALAASGAWLDAAHVLVAMTAHCPV